MCAKAPTHSRLHGHPTPRLRHLGPRCPAPARVTSVPVQCLLHPHLCLPPSRALCPARAAAPARSRSFAAPRSTSRTRNFPAHRRQLLLLTLRLLLFQRQSAATPQPSASASGPSLQRAATWNPLLLARPQSSTCLCHARTWFRSGPPACAPPTSAHLRAAAWATRPCVTGLPRRTHRLLRAAGPLLACSLASRVLRARPRLEPRAWAHAGPLLQPRASGPPPATLALQRRPALPRLRCARARAAAAAACLPWPACRLGPALRSARLCLGHSPVCCVRKETERERWKNGMGR
jgi:hypothetical protein